jgi:DNA-directed RNA polymerase subunit beta
MEEGRFTIAQANAELDEDGQFVERAGQCAATRWRCDADPLVKTLIMMDVSPKQLVSVAAALIPFLENDDANRGFDGIQHACVRLFL